MSTRLPEWLLKARAKAPAAPSPPPRERPVEAGDIRTIAHMDGVGPKAHCVVLQADIEAGEYDTPVARAALVMLATGSVEGATSLDIVLPAEDSGLGYPLLARTDIVGPVLTSQLEGQFLGTVSGSDLEMLQAAASRGASSLPPDRVGLPVRSPRDLRLVEKRADLARFVALSEAAQEDLSEPPAVVDLGASDLDVVRAVFGSGDIVAGEAERALALAGELGLAGDADVALEAAQLAAVMDGWDVSRDALAGPLKWSPSRPTGLRQVDIVEGTLRRLARQRRTLVVVDPSDEAEFIHTVEDGTEFRRQVILISGSPR